MNRSGRKVCETSTVAGQRSVIRLRQTLLTEFYRSSLRSLDGEPHVLIIHDRRCEEDLPLVRVHIHAVSLQRVLPEGKTLRENVRHSRSVVMNRVDRPPDHEYLEERTDTLDDGRDAIGPKSLPKTVLQLLRDQSFSMRDPRSISEQLDGLVSAAEETERGVKDMEEILSAEREMLLPANMGLEDEDMTPLHVNPEPRPPVQPRPRLPVTSEAPAPQKKLTH